MPMCLMPLTCTCVVVVRIITFYLKFGFCWVGWAHETTSQVEVVSLRKIELPWLSWKLNEACSLPQS